MEYGIFTQALIDFSELLTVIVSLFGMIICFFHALFFEGAKDKFSKKLKRVFYTDAAVYLVTFVMGVALFFNMYWLVHADVVVRPFVLILNVYASLRLYKHYKLVK